jgi:hypothetical protein
MEVTTFKNEKRVAYINHTMRSAVIGSLDPERLSYIKNQIEDSFNAGFDFGLDAAEQFLVSNNGLSVTPDWLTDPEKMLAMIEGLVARIGKARYPDEGAPTPEQIAEYEYDDRLAQVERIALRLLDMPHLYGEYMARNDVIEMAIRDAVAWDEKIRGAVK